MIKFKRLVEREEEKRKFDELKGSYSFQGHISHKEDISLRNMTPDAVEPGPVKQSFVDFDADDDLASERVTPRGFWTSTIYKDLEDFTTKWKESPWFNPKGKYFHTYTVQGNPNTRHVGSVSEVERVMEDYRIKENEILPDWKKISKDYDGFHVYGGALETPQFEFWDVESTVWFNPRNYLKEQFSWKLDRRNINNLWQSI